MPWVPSAVLDELLASQRALRELVASGGFAESRPAMPSRQTADASRGLAGGDAATANHGAARHGAVAPDLPPAVVQVCEDYAFGDRKERAANYQIALDMLQKGADAKSIAARIKRGDHIPAFLA